VLLFIAISLGLDVEPDIHDWLLFFLKKDVIYFEKLYRLAK